MNPYANKPRTVGEKANFFISIGLVLLFLLLPAGCDWAPKRASLSSIVEDGEITVITRNNSNCYYLYRERPMGFEYDLAKAFADHLGVTLKIRVARKWEAMIPALLEGEAAFVAANMTITQARKQQVAFTDGYMNVRQHIIVHRRNRSINEPEQLEGKTVHIRKGTAYQDQLEELRQRGIDLQINLHEDVPTEELIRRVAESRIDVTMADTHIARLNRRYYPWIVVGGAISEEQSLGWAVHPSATRLRRAMNNFFEKIRQNGQFKKIYDRYYSDVEKFDFVDLRKYHRRIKTHLPRYQDIIQVHARRYGFDWRLIAAQIYQESHFDPQAISPAGARGLMQLTAPTASELGVKNRFNPHQSVRAGVEYLNSLVEFFDEAEGSDRLNLAFAAYNVGKAHVIDAMALAEKKNLPPNKWSSIEKVLPLLMLPEYYEKARFGYCRGTEPVRYVKRIRVYHDILKRHAISYARSESVGEKNLKREGKGNMARNEPSGNDDDDP